MYVCLHVCVCVCFHGLQRVLRDMLPPVRFIQLYLSLLSFGRNNYIKSNQISLSFSLSLCVVWFNHIMEMMHVKLMKWLEVLGGNGWCCWEFVGRRTHSWLIQWNSSWRKCGILCIKTRSFRQKIKKFFFFSQELPLQRCITCDIKITSKEWNLSDVNTKQLVVWFTYNTLSYR